MELLIFIIFLNRQGRDLERNDIAEMSFKDCFENSGQTAFAILDSGLPP